MAFPSPHSFQEILDRFNSVAVTLIELSHSTVASEKLIADDFDAGVASLLLTARARLEPGQGSYRPHVLQVKSAYDRTLLLDQHPFCINMRISMSGAGLCGALPPCTASADDHEADNTGVQQTLQARDVYGPPLRRLAEFLGVDESGVEAYPGVYNVRRQVESESYEFYRDMDETRCFPFFVGRDMQISK